MLHCVYSILHTHYIRHIHVQASYLFHYSCSVFEAAKIKDSSFYLFFYTGQFELEIGCLLLAVF